MDSLSLFTGGLWVGGESECVCTLTTFRQQVLKLCNQRLHVSTKWRSVVLIHDVTQSAVQRLCVDLYGDVISNGSDAERVAHLFSSLQRG